MANLFEGLKKNNFMNAEQEAETPQLFSGLRKTPSVHDRVVQRYGQLDSAAAEDDRPGFFAGITGGFANVPAGQARWAEINSPFGGENFGETAEFFEDIAKDNASNKYANGAEFSWEYATDPEGFRYHLGNAIGSSAALGLETAAAMAALAQTPIAGAAAAASKIVPGLGKLWNSGILGKVAVGNVAGSGFEALSEGGNLVPELRAEGYSDEEIQDIANRAAALNIGGLTLSNLIQSYGAGKILGLLGGKTGSNITKGGMALAGDLARRGTLAAGGGLITNAGEEGMQSAIGNIAKNEPIDWQEVEANAKTGAATGALMGLGGGLGGGYLQNRALRRAQEQAAAEEENATGFNTIEKMRALEGKIPYEAPDGTNCMRTIGIALEGTPYEGQINVDQAIATARELGQLESPDEYTPQPGDIAVVNGGNHVGMVTENGGIIQNGASHNGVYESEQSAADMFGKVDYYIRTSEYYNGRAGVGRGDLRGEYADEADAATPDVDVPNVRIIPAQGFRTFDTAAAEAADNDANMQQPARRYTIQETLQAQREAEDYRDLTDEALDAVEAWQNYTPPQQAGRFRLPAGRAANYNPTQAIQTPFLDRARNRETARRADELMIENAQAARETAGQRPRFMGQSTPEFRNLLQRTRTGYEQNGANNLRRNAQISALTERAANGDRVAAQILSNALGRQSVRLEAQNNAVEDNEIYKGRVIAERQQRARDAAQREANRRDMLQSAEEYFRSDAFDSPLEGVRSEIKGTQESIKNMLRPIVDTILSGGGNRPMLVDTEDSYRKIRMSQNAPYYSDIYKKYGRRPTLRELYNEARDIYTGNGSVAVPGWERTAENEVDFAHNEATLKELDENLEMYEELEKKFAAEPNGGRRNGENTQRKEHNNQKQRKEHNNQNTEPQESQQGRETGEESKNAEAEKEVTESKEPATKAEKKGTKPAKRPKAEAKFTDKTEKLVPQTAELRGNEITVISKPNAKARDSERYIGRELPEGEYTVTVDEWKKVGRFGNPNAAWHRLVKEKYAAAFPNTGVKAEGMTSGAEPVHDRIIDSQITAIKQAVKAYDDIHAAPAATVTEQQPAADNKRFDGERATSALDKLIGRKQPAQQEQQTSKKFMNVFDESELDAEIAKAKAEMSKLSANPFFNPALMKSLFKIGGIYMQRGVNNFADWSARMVEALGNKVRPFLKSAWDALQAYPADVKFNDDIMTATLEFVGSRAENGRSREQIRSEFSEMYGEEYLSYVDAAYEGVQSYPTEIEENSNVIQEDVRQEAENETQETTAEETENPAQSKTAQEVTRQETQPAEQQGYGRNKDIYIEYNPKTRRLYVDVSKAKNKFREEEVHLIPAGFKWSTARQKWYGVVSDNPNAYDSIRNYAKSIGFEFEDTTSAAQDGAQQAERTTQEQTSATEEKTPQNVKSVDSANRVIINGDRSGIPEIFEANEESYLSWDGTRKTEYNLRKPEGEYFARKMPDGMWEKYGITKQIPLTRLTFKTAEGRRQFANDWVDGKIEDAKESVAAAKEAERKKQEEEQARQRMLDELPDATFNLNSEQNGIEIKFSSKPSEEVRRGLKEARYRWSSAKQLWYAKQTPAAMAFAESIGYVPDNVVQSNQESNTAAEATQQPQQEVKANGHDNDADGHRTLSENVSEEEVPRAESEREAGRVRERDVAQRGSEVTGHSGRAAGERPVSGERGLAGESAAQSSTGSDSERTSERGSILALKPAQKKNAKASEVPGHNFTITDDENIGKGGAKTKYKDNVAAIRLLKQLEAENRLATPEEQKVLARYVGWGGLSPVFSYGRDPAWESEKAEIKELLTDEEYSAARESTLNAHYTSPEVIKGVWKILERLGFKGGKVLEPSMGIGNFFGIMPEKLRNKSSLNGVELDPLTGRIAKQLYQKANVEVTGYEQTKFPDNYFDLVISNVPFGNYKLHDPKYNKYNFNIHNYFFAKSIDQVRPGGIVAFITSTGTLQSGSDSKRLREILKGKADFIGAVRLPDTAFKENAGTEVTTDLIILQKREPGAAPGKNNHAWLDTVDSDLRAKHGNYPLQINEYYRDNPDMLIGELKEDTLYSGGRLALDGRGLDVGKELENRVAKFPRNIYKPRSSERNTSSLESARKFLAPSEVREGQFVLMDDGKVYANEKGEMAELPKAAQKKAKEYLPIRETVKKILDGQINPKITDATLDGWRKELNKLYDKFVAQNGYINSQKNKRYLANDPDFGIVSAIEKYTVDKKKKTETAAKADIFTKRTVNPVVNIEKADSPSDALALSLSNTGAVDVDYMAQLTGQKADDIVKSLKGYIYKDPATDSYVTADDYLSGNVREKLEIAELAAKTDSAMRENVEALKKVQPVDLQPEEISVNLGTPWIPESDIQEFACEMLNMPKWDMPLEVRFNRAIGEWKVMWKSGWRANDAKRSVEANQKWGTARRRFNELLESALNQKTVTVTEKGDGGKYVVNQQETLAAQQKQKEIEEEFRTWIWKDKDRAERLAAYYNRNFNNMRLREYNGGMLTLPGYSAVAPTLKPHQKDAVWRIIQDGTALLAHCVGAGKTWTMQTAAMELKRLGIVNKSMFVIPNHMLQQFENEFRIIYPNAKILTISSETLPDVNVTRNAKWSDAEYKRRKAEKRAERQKTLARIATEDWDGIIISHNMFKRIPMSPEAYNAFYQEQIDIVRAAIIEMAESGDKSSHSLVKTLEKTANDLEAKLKRDMKEEAKDVVIPFEQLGIDEIFVDEADMFKNLYFTTKMQRIGGLSNSNSQRSIDMYMKTQYLAKTNNGRGVVFATGTPISNTMAEMFTMLRYLDSKGLKEKDMDFFDNWAAQFTERETVIERSPDGQGWRQAEKFTKFKNMPELIKMFRKVADVKTQEDLNLDIPKLKNGKTTVIEIEPNSALTNYIKETAAERAQKIHDRRVDPSEDNMLKLTGDLRKASLDMRLIDPTVPASVAEGKIKAVADNVYKKYVESNDTNGAQLVFCDLSVPKGMKDKVTEKEESDDVDDAGDSDTPEEGANVTAYEEIKKMLIKRGVPANEIAFIHDAKNREQKEELFAKVREGSVRVLIGSTEKMGAGTNVQKKLVALHHVDAPWRPRDIEQREGRILRQGNENKEVEIFNYVTKDSFDANMWEKLKNKATMIAQAMSDNLTGRTLEDADANVLSFAEIESLASGNPLVAERVAVSAELTKLEALYGNYRKMQATNERKAAKLPAEIEYNKTLAEKAQKDVKNRTSIEGDKFNITLGKKVFTKRTEAKEALEAYVSNKSSGVARTIGKIGGFELRLRPVKAGETFAQDGNIFAAPEDGTRAELIGENTYTCDATLGKIEYAVMHAPDKALERAQRGAENGEKELKAVQAELAEPFKQMGRYEALKARMAELDAALGITDMQNAPQYSATAEATETRSYDEVIAELENALPMAKFETNSSGEIVAEMPNKARFKVNVADKVIANDNEAAAARSAHGLDGDVNIEGMWQRIKESDVDGALTVSRTGRKGTAYHEVMHAAMDLALTTKERAALVKHFTKKAKETGKSLDEAIADGYAEWVQARKRGSGTMFGKLFNKMRDMYYQLKAAFTGMENAENVMRRIESGEAWTQRSDRSSGNATRYSATESKKLTSGQKMAKAVTNTERKTTWQSVKEWVQKQKDEFYRDWIDKNDSLHGLDEINQMALGRELAEGEKVYNRVQTLPATAAGMANALIEGDGNSIDAVNRRLKNKKLPNKVTLSMVLEKINRKKMDAAHPDFLKKNGYKNWVDAFGGFLTAVRLNEMMLLHDEAYQQDLKEWQQRKAAREQWEKDGAKGVAPQEAIHQEWEEFQRALNRAYRKWNENGKQGVDPRIAMRENWLKTHKTLDEPLKTVGKKPEYKPYLLPAGLTQQDLENVIKTAPAEFKQAAQMYYRFNNNVLTVMEDAGLISAETHKLLNTKYKYYCPLMRDFSDTAAADTFIGGLSNGGRGIGNVSSTLKKITLTGSERNVINPLESTIKAVAVMCNRAERNKVGQLAVEMAEKGGLDAAIQKVEGTTADPQNCVFTVMYNGKKQAYKTTQELYSPIVGYNLPSAGFVLGVARNAARLLRAGATTSPSFIIRNLIRDTIFAGISSKNGFIPLVDTVRGAYALAHDPRLKAEFKVAGVTQFNFYSSSEQIIKSLDEMAGGKAWSQLNAFDIWRALMKYPAAASEFVESATRMGEFMKAREKGLSLEEAAQAARELTLDFSRSGVHGEKVNQIVPFFNAVLQGSDKMIRLLKNDPVGTSAKLAMYIVLPSVALWALNHDEDWYKELDPEVKATCWCLPGGVRIPKPQEAGILFGSGLEAMLDQAFNDDPQAIGNWAKTFGANIAPSILPTIFLPLIEWQANYSFFRGQSITPQRLQNLPDELQYTPNTSAAARTVGGATGLSPVKIDNTIRGYTGTMGMFIVQQFDWFADDKQNMPYKKVSEWPFLRDFAVNQNIQNRSVDDFYTMLHKANEQHAGYGVKGKPSPAVKGVRAAGKLISEAQKDIRELTVNPRLSPEVKRQRIDQKKTYIKNIAKKANARFGRFFEE